MAGESKTAQKSGGKKVTQPDRLCPLCGKASVPVMLMPGRKMVWRHKFDLAEECQ